MCGTRTAGATSTSPADRLSEHRARLRLGGRRHPRAGRPLSAPVLHGGALRAVHRGLQAAGRAFAVRRCRAEEPARQLGRRGDRERGQDRAGRHGAPGVVVFENSFHGRTLLTMAMTGNVKYKRGFGPFPPAVHRVPAPYPFRGITSDDSIAALEQLFKSDVEPEAVACVVLEPVQGEGGFIPMCPTFPPGSWSSAAATGSCTSTTRCNRVSGAHRTRVGDRALRGRARPDGLRQVARRRAAACGCNRSRRGDGRGGSRRSGRHVRG